MRYRAEKTTKQIENEELSRLTEATTQGAEGRPTTQLDPDALRALLGTDEMAPVAPPPAPVAPPLPVASPPVVEAPVVARPIVQATRGIAPLRVESPVVVEVPATVEVPPLVVETLPAKRSRWAVVAICVVIAGAAAALAARSFL